jgi:3-oxoacyl-[acyl-carrier-protein] synthase II
MQRAVITGMGVVSPVGNTIDSFWESLVAGRSGIGLTTRFDTTEFKTKISGQCVDVVPRGFTPRDMHRVDRNAVYAIEAADQAWKHSGLELAKINADRAGVVIGSGIGGIETIQDEVIRMKEGGPRRVSPLMVPKGLTNMASGSVAIRLGLRGPNKAVVTACSTANHCIGEAINLIRLGKADIVLAGGTEAPIIPFATAGFSSMRALSTRNDEPTRASRPFDKDRDGFVMGEGAGILVVESEQHARARGAEILGVAAGLGDSCDAFHITAPIEDGSGSARAIRLALEDAGVNAPDVDYYNAHGTSTQLNEPGEAKALRIVFGDNMPLVSSTKSMTGHLLGAAGAIEAIASVLAIRDGIIPPNINFETPDPECEVNLVANTARNAKVSVVVSNSLGFGGHNAALVLRRYE